MALKNRKPRVSPQISRVSIFLIILVVASLGQQLIFLSNDSSDNLSLLHSSNLPPTAADEEHPGENPSGLENDHLNGLGEIEIANFEVLGIPASEAYISDVEISYQHPGEGTIFNPVFISTVQNADTEHAEGSEFHRESSIIIQLNETTRWIYNENVTDFLVGFTPYLQSETTLQTVYLNGTEVDEQYYFSNESSIPEASGTTFYYNFTTVFEATNNGTLVVTYLYECEMPISNWEVETNPEDGEENSDLYQYINGTRSVITQPFNYNVVFGAELNPFNVRAKFIVALPDPDNVYDVEVTDYAGIVISAPINYTLEENIIVFKLWTNLTRETSFSLKFKADFTVELLDTISGSWSEDRLVSGLTTRERDYTITVSDGPADLMLTYFGFNDTTLHYDDLPTAGFIRSALGRHVALENLNQSLTYIPPVNASDDLIPPTFIDGISLLAVNSPAYHIFKGEIDKITVKYFATHTLEFIVADAIKVPLTGYTVNVYYGGLLFGTRMNAYFTYPGSQKTTNDQGQIIIRNVPVGNFTIELLDANGVPIENLTANSLHSFSENLLVSSVPHIPSIISIFGGLSLGILLIGLFLYRKNN